MESISVSNVIRNLKSNDITSSVVIEGELEELELYVKIIKEIEAGDHHPTKFCEVEPDADECRV